MIKHFLIGLMIAAVMTAMIPSSARTQSFTVGTSAQGSSGYAMTGAMAKVALKASRLRLRAMPQGGPTVTLPLVNQGDLDFSIAVSFVARFGVQGSAMFSAIGPLDDLRVVAALRVLPLGVMVPRDSDVKRLSDFRGRNMPTKFNTQKIMGAMMTAVYEMGGMTAEDIIGFPTPTGERAVEDLIAGRIAGTLYTMDAGLTQQANAKIGIRYIGIENNEENSAILARNAPGAVIGMIEPGDAYAGLDEPVNVIVAPFLLMANKDVHPAVVRQLLEALHDHKAGLVASFSGFDSFNPERMYQEVGMPYHEGALAFYLEIGQLN